MSDFEDPFVPGIDFGNGGTFPEEILKIGERFGQFNTDDSGGGGGGGDFLEGTGKGHEVKEAIFDKFYQPIQLKLLHLV